MTPEERQAARERCEKASEGPWTIVRDGEGEIWQISTRSPDRKNPDGVQLYRYALTGCDENDDPYCTVCTMPVEKFGDGSAWASEDNGEFIVHARTDLPAALKQIDDDEGLMRSALGEVLDRGPFSVNYNLVSALRARLGDPAAKEKP